MTSLASKPRIYMRSGRWWCGEARSTDDNWAIGFGDTQKRAYDNWKRTQRYAFPKQRTERSA